MRNRIGAAPGRALWLGGILIAIAATGLAPALAGDADYKGFYVALDLGLTQPNSLDQHYANHVSFAGTPVTVERLVLDNDADLTGKITFGYGFGEMGKLQISWWGFDNEDDVSDTLLGGVYPTIFGYGPSGGMYAYNGITGVAFSASGKVQADTIDIDYVRSFEPGNKVTIGWLAGLRVASYEEDQAFEAADGYGYYRQQKHFESDGFGLKVGAKIKWGFTEHFGMAGGATWSFLQADTEGNSFQSFAASGTPDDTNQASDDNIRGEIRDYDLKAVWTYGNLDFWVGYAVSNWEGMVTDPVPGNEGGHFAAGPITSRGRDDISFNSWHAGVAFKFGGGS